MIYNGRNLMSYVFPPFLLKEKVLLFKKKKKRIRRERKVIPVYL